MIGILRLPGRALRQNIPSGRIVAQKNRNPSPARKGITTPLRELETREVDQRIGILRLPGRALRQPETALLSGLIEVHRNPSPARKDITTLSATFIKPPVLSSSESFACPEGHYDGRRIAAC